MTNLMMAVVLSTSLALNPLSAMGMNDSVNDIEKHHEQKKVFHIAAQKDHMYYKIKEYNKSLTDDQIHNIIVNVEKYGQKYNVPEKLIYAIIASESRFNIWCKGKLDDTGLMQIREKYAPGWARSMGIEYHGRKSLYNIQKNIHMGTYILSFLIEKYRGDLNKILIGYNWGFGYVDRTVKKGKPLPEGYIKLVKKHYRKLFNSDIQEIKEELQ